MTVSPGESCEGYCGSIGYRGRWYVQFGPCTNKLRAVSVFSAQSQACSQWVLDSEYLRVLFNSEGKMDREMDRWIGAASAVMQVLYR